MEESNGWADELLFSSSSSAKSFRLFFGADVVVLLAAGNSDDTSASGAKTELVCGAFAVVSSPLPLLLLLGSSLLLSPIVPNLCNCIVTDE